MAKLDCGAANNDHVLVTQWVRSEADGQRRSAIGCSDLSQADGGPPLTAYGTATRQILSGLDMTHSPLLDFGIAGTHLSLCNNGSSAFWDLDNLQKPENFISKVTMTPDAQNRPSLLISPKK